MGKSGFEAIGVHMPKTWLARIVAGASIGLGLIILAMVALTLWLAEPRPGPEEPAADIGGSFELVDTEGETVTDGDFRGQYTLVFFGFTNCPDICPMTLTHVTQALEHFEEQAPEAAGQVTPIFITVDPARDDVEAMRAYVAHFHPRMVGLTGSEAQIERAAEAYYVFHERMDEDTTAALDTSEEGNHTPNREDRDARPDEAGAGDHGDYMVQHSSLIYLISPEGEYLDHISHGEGATGIAQMLEDHVGG